MTWSDTKSLTKQLTRRWDQGTLIRDLALKQIVFPYALPIKAPSSGEMNSQYDQVKQWLHNLEESSQRVHESREFKPNFSA